MLEARITEQPQPLSARIQGDDALAAENAKLKAQVSDQQAQLDEQAAAIEELAGIAAGGE